MSEKACRISVFCLLFTLTACFGGGHYAPVVERQERAKFIPDSHVVSRGETLYSIAWRYSKDFRELANTNKIKAPYTIYPGQRLLIKGGSKSTVTSTPSPPSESVTSRSQPTRPGTVRKSQNSSVSASTNEGGWDKKRYPFRWQWPAKGHLLRSFSSASAVHKGIDIQGKLGEPVHAANSGKVVYAGTGLVGYGKLLIIKHDEHYLSAYGHNRRMLVSEGDMVKVGQKIAEFGDTGTDVVKLHFEIRRDGKPINPLTVLPQ